MSEPTPEQQVQSFAASGLIIRSAVPPDLPYTDYKTYLRHDFIYSCAYCTMAESEARGIRFTIDHYEPQGTPDIAVDAYENLMYSCDECNIRKGNRSPPLAARLDGYRFFRPDEDKFQDHFTLSGIRLNYLSNTGFYTIEALDLNRLSLRRIREYRTRLRECDREVADGIIGLARVHIDRLPRPIRYKAVEAIRKAAAVATRFGEEIDAILREHARSPLIDEDPEAAERARARAASLKSIEPLYPGTWRRPRRNP